MKLPSYKDLFGQGSQRTSRGLTLAVLASLQIFSTAYAQAPEPAKEEAPVVAATPTPKAKPKPVAKAAAKTAEAAPAKDGVGEQIKFNVEKYQLPNGLTVLLAEDHSAPLITYQTWFRVGSKNDENGYTGMAHLFEHMMFRGAKRYTGQQFDDLLQSNGGNNNAFTSFDYTGYYENLPSSKLELAIDLESDRMENLQVNAENLKAEREVVKEERRMRVENSPMGVLREALFATIYKVSPYRRPVGGTMADMNAITLEKAQEFHTIYYAPNNATVVVAGDFDPADAKRLIEKYYGHIPSKTIPETKFPAEPKQTAPRSEFITHDVQATQFAISYHTPPSGSDDSYALDLLANIMGSGTSSRLYQRLVYKEQSVAAVGAYNMTLQNAGDFQIFVTMSPKGNFTKVERGIMGELWRPRNMLVKPEELQKAKNQIMKTYVDSLKTIHGKGEALALNETLFRDYSVIFREIDRYNKVTPEQIRAVAKKYLSPEGASLVALKPKGKVK